MYIILSLASKYRSSEIAGSFTASVVGLLKEFETHVARQKISRTTYIDVPPDHEDTSQYKDRVKHWVSRNTRKQ